MSRTTETGRHPITRHHVTFKKRLCSSKQQFLILLQCHFHFCTLLSTYILYSRPLAAFFLKNKTKKNTKYSNTKCFCRLSNLTVCSHTHHVLNFLCFTSVSPLWGAVSHDVLTCAEGSDLPWGIHCSWTE